MRSATSCEHPAWTSTSSRHSTTCCCTSERGPWPCGAAEREAAMQEWYPTRRGVSSLPYEVSTLPTMASEDDLLAAAAAARPFAEAGEAVVGVLFADPFEHGLVFPLRARPRRRRGRRRRRPGLRLIAIDGDGRAVEDTRRVQ